MGEMNKKISKKFRRDKLHFRDKTDLLFFSVGRLRTGIWKRQRDTKFSKTFSFGDQLRPIFVHNHLMRSVRLYVDPLTDFVTFLETTNDSVETPGRSIVGPA